MKKTSMKKMVGLTGAFCLALSMTACGGTTATEEADVATEAAVSEESGTSVETGTYHFDYTDDYGDVTSFTVTLSDGGAFSMVTMGAMGNGVYNGTEWTDNGDGSFTTGAVDGELDVNFIGADGSVRWIVDGSNITPDGYSVPTSFLEKEAEESGNVYIYGQVNDHGSTVPWALVLIDDTNAMILMDNSFTGVHDFYGEYVDNGDGTISMGELSWEEGGDEPMGDWFDIGSGFTASYALDGSTFSPLDFTGSSIAITRADFSDEASAIIAQYEKSGSETSIYGTHIFGQVNDHGSTVPWALVLKEDGTAMIVMDNSFTGVHAFYAEYVDNGDGTISMGELTWEEGGDEPMGDWFDIDNGFTASYTIDGDKFTPVGYTGSSVGISESDFSDEAMSTIQGF
jgi:hypothetical protein